METRLNKYLAQCGVCSRREADKLIEQGKVTINGVVADMGAKVCEGDVVQVGKKVLGGKEETKVYAFYKPIGVTCTEKDKHAKQMISDYVKLSTRVTYAGRLDKDSEGLLLLTNDGELIDAMMRGANRHEKEYVVKVDKEVTAAFLEAMSKGMYLKDLDANTRPCTCEMIGKFTFRIVLTQGLNRQIRRMCAALGYEVKNLKRLRVMNVNLGKLKPGEYRQVQGEELDTLLSLAGRKQ